MFALLESYCNLAQYCTKPRRWRLSAFQNSPGKLTGCSIGALGERSIVRLSIQQLEPSLMEKLLAKSLIGSRENYSSSYFYDLIQSLYSAHHSTS